MSYVINNTRGQLVAVVPDGTINTAATPITLVGRGVTPYGLYENDNYVWLLENFANPTAPGNPILGQLWYNSSTDTLSAWNSGNSWTAIASQSYVTTSIADAKVSPAFTGVPTAPTANASVANTQIATTEFVSAAISNLSGNVTGNFAPINSPVFTGIPAAPTPGNTNDSTQLATTAFVQAQKASPVFTGVPIAPTAATVTANTQIATTAFVQAQKVSPVFTGTPTAPTAAASTNNTQIATTAFVQAQKDNIALTGVPTAPTADVGAANTQIATTDFVATAVINATGSLGSMASQNNNNVNITGGSITGISALAINAGGTGATNAADARTNLGLGSGATTNVGTIASQNYNNVNITGGSITGISPLGLAAGGTGSSTAAGARTAIGAAPVTTTISAGSGLTGGGTLASNMTIAIATNSNGYGTRYVSTSTPSGGSDGDIWYQI